MIQVDSLCKRYGKLQVLNDVSLSFNNGESIALIGPNGSGKTTLIKCLLGLVNPDSGAISIDGMPVLNKSEYRKQLGYMPQISRMPENLKVIQLIEMIKQYF